MHSKPAKHIQSLQWNAPNQIYNTMSALSLISLKIRKTPGVCGGRACVGNTRIPVWTLIGFLQKGATDEDMIRAYPVLTIDHLNLVQEYYEENRAEIERDIQEQEMPIRVERLS